MLYEVDTMLKRRRSASGQYQDGRLSGKPVYGTSLRPIMKERWVVNTINKEWRSRFAHPMCSGP